MFTDNYVVKSLEQHLFFGRIMKEHSLFLEAGFTPADPSFSKRAEYFKREFENLLSHAVMLANGIISSEVLNSGEIVTEFTAMAEKQTQCFTGIQINMEITRNELRLRPNYFLRDESSAKYNQVQRMNQTALRLLDGLISFKEEILQNVLSCKMFTLNYPLLIEHILREAKLYREFIRTLEREHDINDQSMKDLECFWNQIMMEHAMFIRGLLDPTEVDLLNTADDFAKEYAALLTTCHNAYDQTLTSASLEATIKFRDFKRAGTEGIEQCNIRSIILPLLADHVLREANHYIRLLQY